MHTSSSTTSPTCPKVGEWLNFSPLIICGIILAVGLRMFAASLGQNYDLLSYRIVAKIVCAGGNVYSETTRYNYGPIWFYILGAAHSLSVKIFHSKTAFHYLIALFLSLVDLGIFFSLWKKFSLKAAFLFLLSPVSIIITGYHSQFDNLALLFGLWSVLIFDNNRKEYTPKQLTWGILLLSLSITTKHLLFLFPLWLALKITNNWHKLLVLVAPPIIFIASFLPYWAIGHEGIVQNVFLYKSHNDAPFVNFFFPQLVNYINPQVLFFAILSAGALLFQKQPPLRSLLTYSAMLVIFSSAFANQYLVIVAPFIAVFPNLAFIAYTATATWFLLINDSGLNITTIQHYTPAIINYRLLIALLFLGFCWFTYKTTLAKKRTA